jgi:hypothetical protein
LRDAHEKYTQRGRSFRDTLDNVALTKHIAERFIDRIDVGDDTARAKELLDKFDTVFAEIKAASKSAASKDKRLNQGLKEEDLKGVAE